MTRFPTNSGDHAVYVEGPDGPLLTVLSRTGLTHAPAFIVVGGAGVGGSTKADGLFVRVARAVAELGYDTFRFDWHGVGNSLGEVSGFSMQAPYSGDVLAIADRIADEERQIVMAGFCYGSRAAMEAALEMTGLIGLVLVAYPMPEQLSNKQWAAQRVGVARALVMATKPSVIRGWFDHRSRRLYLKWIRLRWRRSRDRILGRKPAARPPGKRTETLEGLRHKIDELIARGVRLRFVYGETDKQLELFHHAMNGVLRETFDRGSGMIEVVTATGDLYGWTTVDAQERAIAIIAEFARQALMPEGQQAS